MDNIIYPADRAELRRWLEEHAASEKEVWVYCIRRKHATILYYLDVVEEALCYGWIDSTTHSLPDREGYMQRLSPRKKNSSWTELNKERCRRLIRLGLMTPAGEAVLPPMGEDSFVVEPWVLEAIKADAAAWEHHSQYHPLYVRIRLSNIQHTRAKVSEARAWEMLEKYIAAARQGKMIGQWNDGGRLIED